MAFTIHYRIDFNRGRTIYKYRCRGRKDAGTFLVLAGHIGIDLISGRIMSYDWFAGCQDAGEEDIVKRESLAVFLRVSSAKGADFAAWKRISKFRHSLINVIPPLLVAWPTTMNDFPPPLLALVRLWRNLCASPPLLDLCASGVTCPPLADRLTNNYEWISSPNDLLICRPPESGFGFPLLFAWPTTMNDFPRLMIY